MIPPFRTLAAEPCTVLDEMGLALTAEFRPADSELALARLDDLAGELAARSCGHSPRDVLACRDLLDRAAGFRATQRFAPESLMLDAVLEQATGHPLLLAVVYAEAGDLTRARHAATLRLSLPLDGPTRARVEREIRGLDARLS